MPALVSVLISLFSPSGAVRPTTASTCCAIRYCAHAWAALASYLESHHTYWTWRPLMPPEALTPCMYARTVSRSTDESTGPLMSKKPPIVIEPPLTPDCDWLLEPVPPEVAVDPPPPLELAELGAWAPETWPLKPALPPCVKERTVITPSTEATTTEPASRATAIRSRMLRATTSSSAVSYGRTKDLPTLRDPYASVRSSTRNSARACRLSWRTSDRCFVCLAVSGAVAGAMGRRAGAGGAPSGHLHRLARLRGCSDQ